MCDELVWIEMLFYAELVFCTERLCFQLRSCIEMVLCVGMAFVGQGWVDLLVIGVFEEHHVMLAKYK